MKNHVYSLLSGACAVFLAGCAGTGNVDTTDLDGPVMGRKDETKFVAGTDGAEIGAGDLARVAKTIRKYKNLGASDQEIIRQVAAMKFQGLVAGEMKRLAPQFEKKKTEVRQRVAVKIAAAQRQGASGVKPAPAVAQEVAAAQAEEASEIKRIDLEWEEAAKTTVAAKYGTDFAVPVQNAEGKAVVAFASVKDSGISVAAASYELAGTSSQLAAAASAGQKVSHEGETYALLDAPVTLR